MKACTPVLERIIDREGNDKVLIGPKRRLIGTTTTAQGSNLGPFSFLSVSRVCQ
jgi:hypothetical protein